MKYSREEFKQAVIKCLRGNEDHFDALRADPERAKAAANNLFMEGDTSSKEAVIVRTYLEELQERGQVDFQDEVYDDFVDTRVSEVREELKNVVIDLCDVEKFSTTDEQLSIIENTLMKIVRTIRERSNLDPEGKSAYQRQDSLRSQLRDLHTKANEMGCYDAADWIRKQLED